MGMAGSLTHDIIQGPPPPPVDGGWGGDGGGGSDGRGAFRRASFTGLYVLLAASTMLFAAFTSAMVVRRGLSDDWASMPKPPILLVNTGILLASSFALEMARRALKSRRSRADSTAGGPPAPLSACSSSAGRLVAWNQLKAAGVFISTNPSSSFFYVLTVVARVPPAGRRQRAVLCRRAGAAAELGPAKRTAIDISAIFWHFLDGLWLYLMVLFYVWG